MLVFIDESGDPGFNLARGSSPLFVAAMAIFANKHDAIATQKAIAESEARKLHKPEFKFSGCQDVVAITSLQVSQTAHLGCAP